MYGSVFNIENSSSSDQEFDLFNTSDVSSSPISFTWTFGPSDLGLTATPIFNRATNLFFDQTISANEGRFAIRMYRADGSSFIVQYGGTITKLQNLTLSQFVDALNSDSRTGLVGTWSGERDGVTSNFTFSVIVSETYIRNENLAQTSTLNWGAESLDWSGTGFTPANAPAQTGKGPSLTRNPNISISSYSDFNYEQFLLSVVQRTYDVKNFQIWSPNQNQLLEPFLFDRTLASGKLYQRVLTPTIDPYQSQNYVVTPESKGYILDGFTKIKYKLLANTKIRLILDYTFIDSSTPLVAKLAQPNINPDYITPLFVANMEKGFSKFGCNFLLKRSEFLKNKLKDVAGASGHLHPKWQEQIKSKLIYIKKLMIDYECMPKAEIEELPQFEPIGDEFRRLDLWMPSPEFVQAQLDSEQGARKLFNKEDFPIVVNDW